MQRVLIIEDSRSTARLIAQGVQEKVGLQCDIAASLAEARVLLAVEPSPYLVALCDLYLPDAPDGSVVDFVLATGTPAVVVSAHFDAGLRQTMLHKGITDYVVKRNPEDMQYLIRLVARLAANEGTEVLVVDDSPVWRAHIAALLRRQRLTVHLAADGVEALEVLEANRNIRLVLTDHFMPRMDGETLTARIRRSRGIEDVAVLAVSSGEGAAAQFLKSGANDYVSKQAAFEELLCRVHMNLDLLDLMRRNRELAERDELTGLYARRRFFERAADLHRHAARACDAMAVVMLDVDHFKRVNDTYGHVAGDLALRQLGMMLRRAFDEPVVAGRYGGEEFGLVVAGASVQGLPDRLEAFRHDVERLEVSLGDRMFWITISAGCLLASACGSTPDSLFARADALLYQAKQQGRNRVVVERDRDVQGVQGVVCTDVEQGDMA